MQLVKARIENVLNNSKVFRDVPGHEGVYKISYNGFVYSFISNKLLKPGLSTNGYLSVVLYKASGEKRTANIHRMVAEAFLPNPEQKKCVNHTTGNKQMNHTAWLEWATHGENNSHAIQTGLKRKAIEPKGVIQMDLEGNVVAIYATTTEAEKAGFSSGNICNCCNGQRKTHKGFMWRYINSSSINTENI